MNPFGVTFRHIGARKDTRGLASPSHFATFSRRSSQAYDVHRASRPVMTTGAFDRVTRLRLILNTLTAERFLRRPLLCEFIALAGEEGRFEAARSAATCLLRELEAGAAGKAFGDSVGSIGAWLIDSSR